MRVPAQLRACLTELSACVDFGWYIPSHLKPLGQVELPTMSCNRYAVWSIEHIDQHAIPGFFRWKRHLADQDLSEAPNSPELWENQFAFYNLTNGDALTLDYANPDPEHQPVRYFSHELAMLHGQALAPNFFAFITQMSRLGMAGTEWASWMIFGEPSDPDAYYLRADSAGGKAWLDWLSRDHTIVQADEPPPAVVERTAADRALLDAARAGSVEGVSAALEAGAQPDCVPSSDWKMKHAAWDDEFMTALNYAVRRNDLDMIERLLQVGATLDTRRLPLSVAVAESSLATVQWLIAKGARINRWKGQRKAPLHELIDGRGEHAQKSRAVYAAELQERAERLKGTGLLEKMLAKHLEQPEYEAMLRALLQAGADVDAKRDGHPVLFECHDVATAKLLLDYGADPNATGPRDETPLHRARTSERARLLVQRGAEVNALSQAEEDYDEPGRTPLHYAVMRSKRHGSALVKTLLELGADPLIPDSKGNSTLAYCGDPETFQLLMTFGLDPLQRQSDGKTLLHTFLEVFGPPRVQWPAEVAFLDFLLGLGLQINAQDDKGRTILHLACERESWDEAGPNYELLLARGADPSIRDHSGKRPVDRLARSLKTLRALLKV